MHISSVAQHTTIMHKKTTRKVGTPKSFRIDPGSLYSCSLGSTCHIPSIHYPVPRRFFFVGRVAWDCCLLVMMMSTRCTFVHKRPLEKLARKKVFGLIRGRRIHVPCVQLVISRQYTTLFRDVFFRGSCCMGLLPFVHDDVRAIAKSVM